MAIPTLRRHNQVTIPAKLALQTGLKVGTPLSFTVEENKIVIESAAVTPVEEEWLTPEIVAEIEASDAGTRESFETTEQMLASLRA